MPIAASGHQFYVDDYGQQYDISWDTTETNFGPALDFTTTVRQPSVWGRAQTGDVANHVAYADGICSIVRVVLIPASDGYVVVAEGSSQELCRFPITFQCQPQPVDNAKYHLDSAISDEFEYIVATGPRWADPANPADLHCVWEPEGAGGTVRDTTATQPLTWVDVWS